MVPLDTAPAGGLGLHVVYQTCSLVTMSWGESDFTVHLTMRPASDERVRGCESAAAASALAVDRRPPLSFLAALLCRRGDDRRTYPAREGTHGRAPAVGRATSPTGDAERPGHVKQASAS